jgi:hypothetical protein
MALASGVQMVFLSYYMARRFDPDQSPELPPDLQALLPTAQEFAKNLGQILGQQHAVLDENGEAQPATFMQWAHWLQKNQAHRRIESTDIARQLPGLKSELYCVSTVFLGLNHQYVPEGKPLWFETIVFGPPHRKHFSFLKKTMTVREDLWMRRCTTKAEALAQHAEGVVWLKAHITELDIRMERPDERHEPSAEDVRGEPSPLPDSPGTAGSD